MHAHKRLELSRFGVSHHGVPWCSESPPGPASTWPLWDLEGKGNEYEHEHTLLVVL